MWAVPPIKEAGKEGSCDAKGFTYKKSTLHGMEFRPSPLASPCQSEDKMDTDAGSGEQSAIQGLLEMAAM